jgi:nucleoid-associated protein YgaU
MAARIRTCILLAATATALVAVGAPPELLTDPGRIGQPAATPDEVVGMVAAAGAWLLVVWLAAATAVTASSALPGHVGRAGRMVSRLITPRIVRRTVETAIGLTVVAAPIVSPGGSALADETRPQPATALPSLDRPAGGVLPPAHPPAGVTTYVVRPGDCLWSIAARHLGPNPTSTAIAQSWPEWYAGNRGVIGRDPNVLHAGQRLVVPRSAR